MITIIDSVLVFFFGLLLMLFLLGVVPTKKQSAGIIVLSVCILLAQYILFNNFGENVIYKIYPLLSHLPLLIFFVFGLKRKLNISLFALCSAYAFTTPRKWIGELAFRSSNSEWISFFIKNIVAIFILILVYIYLRPAILKFIVAIEEKDFLIIVAPLIYYIFVYITTVYSDLVYKYSDIYLGLLATTIIIAFYTLLVKYFNALTDTYKKKNEDDILFISEKNLKTDLIKIEKLLVTEKKYNFSSIASINNLLSFYKTECDDLGIDLNIKYRISDNFNPSITDFCIVIIKAFEDALRECKKVEVESKEIYFAAYEKSRKIYLEIRYSCKDKINIINGIPDIKDEKNLGSRIILLIATKYGGICSFKQERGFFVIHSLF